MSTDATGAITKWQNKYVSVISDNRCLQNDSKENKLGKWVCAPLCMKDKQRNARHIGIN